MRKNLRIIWLWCALTSVAVAGEPFPRPPEILDAVAFWTRVYTEVDSNSGFLHDSLNLGVVYETLDFDDDASSRERGRIRDQAAEKYEDALKTLGSGKRKGLSALETRVLGLWPPDTSNKEFDRAADRIRFQLGQSDRYLAGLVRSGRWREHIHAVLDAAGLPHELDAMPHVESSFDPTAYSRVGAAGLWQFTRSTGLRYMQIDHIVDERRDPYLSTEAAIQLLKDNYDVIGSWPLAITAYNHGLAGMRRAVRQVGTDDIGKIITEYEGSSFGFASRNFYPAFLAALDVDRNASKYFGAIAIDPEAETTVVVLPDYVDAKPLAASFNVPLNALQRLNPALLEPVWAGDKYIPRGFPIRLPASAGTDSAALLASIPSQQRFSAQRPDLYHRVQRGDTLSEIAARYGVSLAALERANGLSNRNFIRVGQQLTLPVSGSQAITVAAIQETAAEPPEPTPAQPTPEAIAAVTVSNEEDEDLMSGGQATLSADPSDYTVAGNGTIEVQDMETLGHYADWLDIRTQRLRDLNGFAFERAVVVGERIKLDFSSVDQKIFEARRMAYQAERQESFFLAYQIDAIVTHVVEPGESMWLLALREFDVPVWLLRQYNPDLDLDHVNPGTVVRFPRLRSI